MGKNGAIMKRVIWLFCVLLVLSRISWADPGQRAEQNTVKTENHAFSVGEKLTYSISWSSVIEAGIATMEVKEGKKVDGRRTYDVVSSTHSVGLVDLLFPVRDTVESIIDADKIFSLSYHVRESHGKRTRQNDMDYDRAKGTVRVIINNGTPETYAVPDRIQDALSALYYIRTRQDFTIGKTIVVNVHDGDRTWAVEVHVLGKERIKTPLGKFDTIKVKTYPKYEGVFMNKGDIYIWFTDDSRKIPLIMKSKIAIGSIVATIIDIQERQAKP
jgi:Protein of unknown function (DUF3108)